MEQPLINHCALSLRPTEKKESVPRKSPIPDSDFASIGLGAPKPKTRRFKLCVSFFETSSVITILGYPKPLKQPKKRRVTNMETQKNSDHWRKRNVLLRFRVTESERDMIFEKMKQLKTNNLAAYMRKMAIDGYIVNVDYSDLKSVAYEMQKIGVNINQIARRVNSTSRMYEQDFEEIKMHVDQIWQLLRMSLSRDMRIMRGKNG